MIEITSRDNPLLKSIRRLAQDANAYRKQGQIWLEGDHLCRAALSRGVRPQQVVLTSGVWKSDPLAWRDVCDQVYVVSEDLFATLSGLESPAQMGFLLDYASAPALQPASPTVVLDRVQDAGNVGSILRTAAAAGFTKVLTLSGCAHLWSSKVLRAGMGAHRLLDLYEGWSTQQALSAITAPMLAASANAEQDLYHLKNDLLHPVAWVMGSEGQGVSEDILAQAKRVSIPIDPRIESLNVSTAAAICLFETMRVRRS